MPSKTTSVIIGGLAGAMVATVFQILQASLHDLFGLVTCFAYVGCGLVAVWHYTNEHSLTLTGGQGVGLGAKAGAIGGLAGAALAFLLQLAGVMPSKEEALAEAMEAIEAAGGQGAEFTETWINFMYGGGGILVAVAVGALMGLIGGAIGRAIWKKGEEESAEA